MHFIIHEFIRGSILNKKQNTNCFNYIANHNYLIIYLELIKINMFFFFVFKF